MTRQQTGLREHTPATSKRWQRTAHHVFASAQLAAIGLLLACAVARANTTPADLLDRYRRAREVGERETVVRALATTAGATAALGELLALEPEERLRLLVVEALVKVGTADACKTLLAAVDRWDPFVVDAAVRALGTKGVPPETVTWLVTHGLDDEAPADRQAMAITLLAAVRRDDALPAIRKALKSGAWRVRAAAASALAALDPGSALRDLRPLASDPHVRVRIAALAGLAAVPDDAATKVLRKAVKSDDAWQARLAALRGLEPRERDGDRALARDLLTDTAAAWQLRLAALEQLAGWRDPRAVAAMIDALRTDHERLRVELLRALDQLTAQPFTERAEWQAWWRVTKEGFVFPDAVAPVAKAEDDPRRTRVRFFGLPIESSSPCFVIDASGSMAEPATPAAGEGTRTAGAPPPTGPTKLQVARQELLKALEALPQGAHFGLILFTDRVIPLAQTPVPATKANFARAAALLDAHQPSGATDIYGALASLFHAGEPNDPEAAARVAFDTIVLLSDGHATAGVVLDGVELRRRVREFNRFANVRVHAVGLGADHDKALLQGMAEDTRGSYVAR